MDLAVRFHTHTSRRTTQHQDGYATRALALSKLTQLGASFL